MCGIVTMIRDSSVGATAELCAKILRQGIMMDTLRGDHSTGIACVKPNEDVSMLKEAISGYDFVQTDKYTELMKNQKYDYIIAHNRYATAGAINALNAHPFQHNSITGVHNGTVYDCEPAGLNWNANSKDELFETDSEHLIHGLSTKFTEDIISGIDGAFVLVWHDADTNTVHFARNKERSIFIAHCRASRFVFAMSEEFMLHSILLRNNIYDYEITELKSGTELIYNKDDLFNPEVREHKLTDWYGYNYGYGYNSGYNSNTYNYKGTLGYQKNRTPDYNDNSGTDVKKSLTPSQSGMNSSSNNLSYMTGATVTVVLKGWEKHKGAGFVHGVVQGTDQKVRFSKVQREEYTDLLEDTRTVTAQVKGMYWKSEQREALKDANREKVYSLNFATVQPVYPIQTATDQSQWLDDDPLDTSRSPFFEEYYVKDGICISTSLAESLIKDGCHSCKAPIALEDFDLLEWLDESPICPECDINWYIN